MFPESEKRNIEFYDANAGGKLREIRGADFAIHAFAGELKNLEEMVIAFSANIYEMTETLKMVRTIRRHMHLAKYGKNRRIRKKNGATY